MQLSTTNSTSIIDGVKSGKKSHANQFLDTPHTSQRAAKTHSLMRKKRCLKKAREENFFSKTICVFKEPKDIHKTATRKIIIASRQIIANKHHSTSEPKMCVYFTFFFLLESASAARWCEAQIGTLTHTPTASSDPLDGSFISQVCTFLVVNL